MRGRSLARIVWVLIAVSAFGGASLGADVTPLYRIVQLTGSDYSVARLINDRADVVFTQTTYPPPWLFSPATTSSFFWTKAGGAVHIPGNGANTIPADLNATGQVVGYTGSNAPFDIFVTPPHYDAFSWTAHSGTTLIPGFLFCPGYVLSYAHAVNDVGTLVGLVSANCRFGPGYSYGFTWSAGTGEQGTSLYGRDLNDSGQIVGSNSNRAFLEDGDTLTDLGTLGGATSEAIAISNGGHVAGTSDTSAGARHAFFWTATGGMRDLGTLGGPNSSAVGVNNFGQVIGNSDRADGTRHAFSWTLAGGMIDLGTLGGQWSQANDVNNRGQVVGVSELADGTSHAFSWTPAGGMIDLGTLGGATSEARALNDRGEIVGWSLPAGGTAGRAVLWEPINPEQILSNLIYEAFGGNFIQGGSLLRNALASLGRSNTTAACNQIAAFTNQVRAQSGKSLSAVQATQWLVSATQVTTMIGCR